jgi:hypothetical protein
MKKCAAQVIPANGRKPALGLIVMLTFDCKSSDHIENQFSRLVVSATLFLTTADNSEIRLMMDVLLKVYLEKVILVFSS